MLEFLTKKTPDTIAHRRPATLTLRASQDATIEETSPPWIREVNKRLEYLRRLRANWDGEGAPAIDFECCINSLRFLLERAANETPAPQIVPTYDGGLQLEWHTSGIDLEITFSPHEPAVFFYVAADGRETEGEVEKEGQKIGNILRALPARNERHRPAK
ncbi:MAG: hypothetical protein M3Y50_00950 [Acidobacteriota bacterium]|nr:hypothetical protein [Acidobacteriota bacterium]